MRGHRIALVVSLVVVFVASVGGLMWRAAAQDRVIPVHFSGGLRTGYETCAAFSPDGKVLASGGQDENVRLWDVATGKQLRSLRRSDSDSAHSVAFSPDGRLLASAGGKIIYLWDLSTGTLLRSLNGLSGAAFSVAFSPDGRLLASGERYAIHVWDVATGERLRSLSSLDVLGESHGSNFVAFTPDGRVLASVGRNEHVVVNGLVRGLEVIHLWDSASGKQLRSWVADDYITSIAFSPDGRFLASGGIGGIRIWDVAGGALRSFGSRGSDEYVALSPDGRMLASGGSPDATAVRLWDVATGKLVRSLEVGATEAMGYLMAAKGVTSVAFSPDGQVLAATVVDQTIRLWDLRASAAGATRAR